MDKLIGVTANFLYEDHTGKQYTITADFNDESWEQYGAFSHQLGNNVEVVEAINEVVSQFISVPSEI